MAYIIKLRLELVESDCPADSGLTVKSSASKTARLCKYSKDPSNDWHPSVSGNPVFLPHLGRWVTEPVWLEKSLLWRDWGFRSVTPPLSSTSFLLHLLQSAAPLWGEGAPKLPNSQDVSEHVQTPKGQKSIICTKPLSSLLCSFGLLMLYKASFCSILKVLALSKAWQRRRDEKNESVHLETHFKI